MGRLDRFKKLAAEVAEETLTSREHRVSDHNLASAGDLPSAGALADAAAQTPEVASASFPCEGDLAFPVGTYVPNDGGWVLLWAAGSMPRQLGETSAHHDLSSE